MTKSNLIVTALFFAAIAGVIALKTVNSGVAPTPAAFADGAGHASLDAAIAESRTTGHPVFALATADWCPPCQALKRNALADARVESWLRDKTEPVYLDVTDRDSRGAADASRLEVTSIPAMYLIEDGTVIAQYRGNLSAEELLRWLQSAG